MKSYGLLRPRSRRNGFTLTEFLLVIAFICLFLVFGRMRYSVVESAAREVTFESNHRLLVAAFMMYVACNDGGGPSSYDDVRPYLDWDITGTPSEAVYRIEEGEVRSEYGIHRNEEKRILVWQR